MVCFQETEIQEVSEKIIKSLWNLNSIGWFSSTAWGNAGGILVMWNKDMDWLSGETTASCLFNSSLNGFEWFFTGVYCRDNNAERTTLWE